MGEKSSNDRSRHKMRFEDLVYAYLDQKFVLKSRRLDEKYPSRETEKIPIVQDIETTIEPQMTQTKVAPEVIVFPEPVVTLIPDQKIKFTPSKQKMNIEELVFAFVDKKLDLKKKKKVVPMSSPEKTDDVEKKDEKTSLVRDVIPRDLVSAKPLDDKPEKEKAQIVREVIPRSLVEKPAAEDEKMPEYEDPKEISQEKKPKDEETLERPESDVLFYFKDGVSAQTIQELKSALEKLSLSELQGYIDRRDFINYLESKGKSKLEIDQFITFATDMAVKKEQKEADRVADQEADRIASEEAEQKAQEDAERKAREEVERKAKEEAEQKAREEAERKAKEEAEQKAQEEAERKAREEAEQKAKEEAERKAREEAERKAREEAERKAREEAERKAREEAERKAKEEAERKAKEEAERKAKEEAEQKAQEEAALKTKYSKILAWIDGDFEETTTFEDNRIELAFDEANKKLILNVPKGTGLVTRRTVDRRIKSIIRSGYEFHDLSARLGTGYEIVEEAETIISAALLMEGHKYGGSQKKRPDSLIKLAGEENVEKE